MLTNVMAMVATGVIVAIAFTAIFLPALGYPSFGWVILIALALSLVLCFLLVRKARARDREHEDSETENKSGSGPPDPQVEISSHVAPEGASPETKVRTVMSTSNHPLTERVGAFYGFIGFLLDLAIASGLFWILAGWVRIPNPATVAFFGLNYPMEAVAALAAVGYYMLTALFSVRRQRSSRGANLDFLGSFAVAAVLLGAAGSFHPAVAAFMTKTGLPIAAYSSINVAVLAFFGIAVVSYIWKYHVHRAEVGLEAIEGGRGSGTEIGKTALDNALSGDKNFSVLFHEPKKRLVYEYVPDDRPVRLVSST